jgi:hypothetical protein
MSKTPEDSQNNVTLEELLRFKRAEKPDEAFWNRFDQELHQRTLRALVKKDPWYVQIMRGLSGKIAQTTAVGAVAAVLAMMVVRPAFVMTTGEPAGEAFAVAADHVGEGVAVAVAEVGLDAELYAQADYGIEVYAADVLDGSSGVTREFGLDRMEASSYDRSAYSADSALGGFASSSVASLVF